jgi:hypothetical protein
MQLMQKIRILSDKLKMIITLMGRNYISELRPSAGQLFIFQVIYKHGEPWWNDDVDTGKLLMSNIESSWVILLADIW